jgi:hypothetical protein
MSESILTQRIDNLLLTYEVGEGDKVKEAPERRLVDAVKLRSIHETLKRQDRVSERNRSKIQDMVDGKPPLSQGLLNQRGRGHQFNVNFGEGASIRNEAMSHYLDMFTAPEFLLDVRLKRTLGLPSTMKTSFEKIISSELTKMVRDWEGSTTNFLILADQFVTHGVGIGYFTDKDSWQFETTGLGEFKFPRRTKVSPDSIDVCTCETELTVSQLTKYIQNESAAEAAGWDVEACKLAIAKNGNGMKYDHDSYEDLQEQAKANDYNESDGLGAVVVVQAWVQEKDGKVSYYISTQTGVGNKENETKSNDGKDKKFLFKAEDAYDSMEEAIHIFPFYTGNRGNIYTIRGLGYMVYGLVQTSNLMQCASLDSARAAMSVKLQSPSEKSIDQIPIVHAGPYTLIPPSLTISEKQIEPNLSQVAFPAMNQLSQQIAKMSASSSMSQMFNGGQDRRSALEVSTAAEHFSSLNSAAMRLFYKPWRSMLVQMSKRALRPSQNKSTPSGNLASIMQQRCVDRGIPIELLTEIDWIETNTKLPIGLGNKAARSALYNEGASMLPFMDDVGKHQFNVDRMIDMYGPEKAQEYMPFDGEPRETPDHQIARLESNDLIEGQEIPVSNSENRFVHLRIHVEKLVEVVDSVESGEADLREVTSGLANLYEHASQTLELTAVPGVAIDELQQYKQVLQQIGEVVQNGLRQLEADQRNAEEAQQAAAEAGGAEEGSDDDLQKMQMETAKVQQQLHHKQQLHEQSLQHKQELKQVDIALKDAETAGKIKRG